MYNYLQMHEAASYLRLYYIYYSPFASHLRYNILYILIIFIYMLHNIQKIQTFRYGRNRASSDVPYLNLTINTSTCNATAVRTKGNSINQVRVACVRKACNI